MINSNNPKTAIFAKYSPVNIATNSKFCRYYTDLSFYLEATSLAQIGAKPAQIGPMPGGLKPMPGWAQTHAIWS